MSDTLAVRAPGGDGGPARATRTLRVRWLGEVPYREAHALQHGLFAHGDDDWLLLCEHPAVYTLGVRADPANVLVPPGQVGAELVRTDRGGDVTYHGPGQLVGYPIRDVVTRHGGAMADTVAYVTEVEQLLIDALGDLGLHDVGRRRGYPGVWVDPHGASPAKVAAIGVRLVRGRSMHGFALNVDPDLSMFDHIVPCGITDASVTSLAAEGVDAPLRDVAGAVAARAAAVWAPDGRAERSDVVWRHRPDDLAPFSRGADAPHAVPVELGQGTTARRRRRLAEAGVDDAVSLGERKPPWLRAPVQTGERYRALRRRLRDLELVTVCEEAGCPNIYECWAAGTATFMINGERCTRACGFCLVDTRRPVAPDPGEPERVATAVAQMGLEHAVVTAVARDDLPDGGAAGFAATIHAIRRRCPQAAVEVLIPDCRGDEGSLAVIFDAQPDVCNHNLETVARLQRAVRPSAGYARSLAVLARAKAAGLTTKSGIIVGLGEDDDEVAATLADLAGVGCDIVTVGHYLRPTAAHLPVARWVTPAQFDEYRRIGEDELGIPHVESSPFTRSSYHAREAAGAAAAAGGR